MLDVQNLSEILADGFSRLELPYVSIAFSVYPLITCKFSILESLLHPTPTREEEGGGGQDPSLHDATSHWLHGKFYSQYWVPLFLAWINNSPS